MFLFLNKFWKHRCTQRWDGGGGGGVRGYDIGAHHDQIFKKIENETENAQK